MRTSHTINFEEIVCTEIRGKFQGFSSEKLKNRLKQVGMTPERFYQIVDESGASIRPEEMGKLIIVSGLKTSEIVEKATDYFRASLPSSSLDEWIALGERTMSSGRSYAPSYPPVMTEICPNELGLSASNHASNISAFGTPCILVRIVVSESDSFRLWYSDPSFYRDVEEMMFNAGSQDFTLEVPFGTVFEKVVQEAQKLILEKKKINTSLPLILDFSGTESSQSLAETMNSCMGTAISIHQSIELGQEGYLESRRPFKDLKVRVNRPITNQSFQHIFVYLTEYNGLYYFPKSIDMEMFSDWYTDNKIIRSKFVKLTRTVFPESVLGLIEVKLQELGVRFESSFRRNIYDMSLNEALDITNVSNYSNGWHIQRSSS